MILDDNNHFKLESILKHNQPKNSKIPPATSELLRFKKNKLHYTSKHIQHQEQENIIINNNIDSALPKHFRYSDLNIHRFFQIRPLVLHVLKQLTKIMSQ